MTTRVHILVSLAALFVIGGSARFAYCAERLRSPEYLRSLYAATNRQYFNGDLPDARIEFGDLADENAMAHTTREGEQFVIVIDRKWNGSEDQVRANLDHEMCHVQTFSDAEEFDFHGPEWQACIRRFN
jgi:hypothetical protein